MIMIMIMTMKTSMTFHAGTAKATALMVKLGLLGLVRDIVAKLSQQGRADVVSQVNQASLLVDQFHLCAAQLPHSRARTVYSRHVRSELAQGS